MIRRVSEPHLTAAIDEAAGIAALRTAAGGNVVATGQIVYKGNPLIYYGRLI